MDLVAISKMSWPSRKRGFLCLSFENRMSSKESSLAVGSVGRWSWRDRRTSANHDVEGTHIVADVVTAESVGRRGHAYGRGRKLFNSGGDIGHINGKRRRLPSNGGHGSRGVGQSRSLPCSGGPKCRRGGRTRNVIFSSCCCRLQGDKTRPDVRDASFLVVQSMLRSCCLSLVVMEACCFVGLFVLASSQLSGAAVCYVIPKALHNIFSRYAAHCGWVFMASFSQKGARKKTGRSQRNGRRDRQERI